MVNDLWDARFLNVFGIHQLTGFLQFSKNEFEPELKRLVNDDEVEFVVRGRRRIAVRPVLEGQQFLQPKITSVGDSRGGVLGCHGPTTENNPMNASLQTRDSANDSSPSGSTAKPD